MIHELPTRIDGLRGSRVLVLGDLILDRYTWGNAERVSPEAPVLVLRADEHEVRPGGAASVAMLLRHLEAKVTLAGVVGDDAGGRSLTRILDDERIDHELVCCIPGRPTTTKERFMGRAANRHPHQILRVDHETRASIDAETVSSLLDGILRRIAEQSVIIISDYDKGCCTEPLLQAVIAAACERQIPVVVDPARIEDFARYRRATIVKPNRIEAELAAGRKIHVPEDGCRCGVTLCDMYDFQSMLITLDADGIAVVDARRGEQYVVSAQAREVYDITGAGDMVVAITGLCQAAGWPLDEIARIANAAAGLEIERLGVAPLTWDQILTPYPANSPRTAGVNSKLVTPEALSELVADYRTGGKSIVFTNGCFDLLHVGHVGYLQEAARLGDVLMVAVNSDVGVRRLKGPDRPVIGERDRAALLAALACVDHVVIFDDDTPHELLRQLRPDVLVKGGTTDEVIGREVVEAYGGRVCTTPAIHAGSTTEIVESIQKEKCLPDKNEAINA